MQADGRLCREFLRLIKKKRNKERNYRAYDLIGEEDSSI